MKIIQESEHCEEITYRLNFNLSDKYGAGFSFDCTEDGTVDIDKLKKRPCAFKNYSMCLSGEHKVDAPTIEEVYSHWTEPRIGECDCGEEVDLSRFTNTCDKCGTDYNSAGQELAPREQWGEETSEYLSDILRIR